ncbi:CoA-transferase subunit beta [Metallosphaera tengchongensis]|uniref:CoA-transferase subunit beta n=1 Tax=Metallosphaera tengchongensis TaxID=1532350 RepID=A0A6N0NQZ3_9CREN|nr:CoA-transferase [Metallosphaera tengchongensis]QKQ99145.1 CoA-transferase subunit beta [Metallosphaera tengchongensis]
MRIDYVIKAIASLLEDGELVYVGLNSGPALLGAFLARDMLKKDIDIVGVAEAFNPNSITFSPSTGSPFFLEGSPVMTTADSFDLAQKGKLDVMFLGPAQVDQETNVNLTGIGGYEKPSVKLPGGAATAYLMPLVKKMILWNLKHSKTTLVEKVDFVTGTAKHSGNRVYLVTNLGVMRYNRAKRKWEILYYYPWSEYEDFEKNTGFPFDVANGTVVLVREEEMAYLDKIDPYNLRSSLDF